MHYVAKKAVPKNRPSVTIATISLFVILNVLYQYEFTLSEFIIHFNYYKDKEFNISSIYFTESEANEFKHNLDKDKIMQRTSNCDLYFSELFSNIYNLPANDSYQQELWSTIPQPVPKLAISYVIHDNVGLFEILFHINFRPHHTYCIYIDSKTSEDTQTVFKSILKCYQATFQNIIIVNNSKPIYWGGYSQLDATLTCLERLMKHSKDWKYFMNMAGTELPMIDIDEFAVKIANAKIPYSVQSRLEPKWTPIRWTYVNKEEFIEYGYNNINLLKSPFKIVFGT